MPTAYSLNTALQVHRLPQHQEKYFEIKDPSVVTLVDGTLMMYASIGNSAHQEWIVGRFMAVHPAGPWHEVEPVSFANLSGPQVCAPAVMYEISNGQPLWKMYIQTACFEADGVIVLATSRDGQHFEGQPQPLASRHTLSAEYQPLVTGVYDAGVSEIRGGNEEMMCMLFSGYRRVGCGDIYASYRPKSAAEHEWSPARRLLAQEEVPFHNHPNSQHFEWGLEGAKLVQLSEKCFLLVGVCFLPKPDGFLGTRQRVFFAVSSSMDGPFRPVGTPLNPFENEEDGRRGENGHPDTLFLNEHDLWIIYQERHGDGAPWHLRAAHYDAVQLGESLAQEISLAAPSLTPATSLSHPGTDFVAAVIAAHTAQ